MTTCDDLSDVSAGAAGALVPAWLDLVAARVVAPGAPVRRTGHTVHVECPEGLLVTLWCDADSQWNLRVQALLPTAELGRAGRQFSVVGSAPLSIPRGCGNPAVAAAALTYFLDLRASLERLTHAPHPALLDAWKARLSR